MPARRAPTRHDNQAEDAPTPRTAMAPNGVAGVRPAIRATKTVALIQALVAA